MAEFRTDLRVEVNAALFVINKLGGKTDFHQLFKILYFADRKHVALYGKPITGDTYIAMPYGPVPSTLYDILKFKGGRAFFTFDESILPLIEPVNVEGYNVNSQASPDLDFLSESAIEILTESFAEHGKKGFGQRSDDSHDAAWKSASENSDMSYLDMAQVEGASKEMQEYIKLNIENQIVFNDAGFPRRSVS